MTVPHLTSSALSGISGIRHGFFGREGGVSIGLYASLNCGLGSRDDPSAVEGNRAAVARAIGAAPETLVTAYQCHSANALAVDRPFSDIPSVDALVTATPDLVLGVLAADCGPVLFATGDGTVVGAAHAGWKGALGGILESAVAAMEGLGARRRDVRACLGPCIGPASYEMGEEVRQAFVDSASGYAAFFTRNDKGRFQFDLPGFILHRLRALELAQAEAFRIDTYAEPERFFSYRRTTHAGGSDYGRQISAIAIVKL